MIIFLFTCFLIHSLVHGRFLFSSILYLRTRSFACFVPDSLTQLWFFLSFPRFLSPLLIHLFAFSFTHSLALLFGLPLSLASFLRSSLFHSLSHVLTQNLLIHSPTHSFFRFLTLCSLACPFLLPPSLPHSPFIHLLAHIPARLLACSLPSSLTSYHTSLLGCFLSSSLLYPRTRSYACFVADSLSHSFTFFLFFPHSLARPTASFRLHSPACFHVLSLTRSLPCFFPFRLHSLIRSLKNLLAR